MVYRRCAMDDNQIETPRGIVNLESRLFLEVISKLQYILDAIAEGNLDEAKSDVLDAYGGVKKLRAVFEELVRLILVLLEAMQAGNIIQQQEQLMVLLEDNDCITLYEMITDNVWAL